MFSKKFTRIFIFTVVLIFLHMVEEVWGNFYMIDPTLLFLSHLFSSQSQGVYFMGETVFRIMLGLLLLVILGRKWALWVLALYGVLLVGEIDHVVKAIEIRRYYPGSMTALMIVVTSFFYWKALLIEWKSKTTLKKAS